MAAESFDEREAEEKMKRNKLIRDTGLWYLMVFIMYQALAVVFFPGHQNMWYRWMDPEKMYNVVEGWVMMPGRMLR